MTLAASRPQGPPQQTPKCDPGRSVRKAPNRIENTAIGGGLADVAGGPPCLVAAIQAGAVELRADVVYPDVDPMHSGYVSEYRMDRPPAIPSGWWAFDISQHTSKTMGLGHLEARRLRWYL